MMTSPTEKGNHVLHFHSNGVKSIIFGFLLKGKVWKMGRIQAVLRQIIWIQVDFLSLRRLQQSSGIILSLLGQMDKWFPMASPISFTALSVFVGIVKNKNIEENNWVTLKFLCDVHEAQGCRKHLSVWLNMQ